MEKTLGGDRLGSGKKMKVHLHNYERSTHDLGYIWRSTMAAGTLVPFMKLVGLPGDTFDINLDCDIKTHPTIGPLFGSYKIQLDVFQAPIRLYQGQLHNNKLGIGLNMANVKMPLLTLTATKAPGQTATNNIDNAQINPSSILAYLGIRGIGALEAADLTKERQFNGVPWLAYWDIYKQYYSNKQEEIGAVIHTPAPSAPVETVTAMEVDGEAILEAPAISIATLNYPGEILTVTYSGGTPASGIVLNTDQGAFLLDNLFFNKDDDGVDTITYYNYKFAQFGTLTVQNYSYFTAGSIPNLAPEVQTFSLANIDTAREAILGAASAGAVPFDINLELGIEPYSLITENTNESLKFTQEGLGIKTYQSDLFNNWLRTDYIDQINAVSAVSTAGDEFTIDALQLAKKVYDMLNRIAVSGGTYDDWLDAVYMNERVQRAESPIYHGGLIRELVFQEVVSNAETETEGSGSLPLGTLAGKGVMGSKKKGGSVVVKVDEPSYIIGIISLTPRIDYSQGNDWDIHILTMDDLHKPALDEIGFQELITEQMAWWSTAQISAAGDWITISAGKQPAWINYMTNINKTYGNFAVQDNEMFMTLNRRYERNSGEIQDLTTYIDPVKFNQIFAQTSIDAQNFWAQIGVDITARRKMSAKVMPNL